MKSPWIRIALGLLVAFGLITYLHQRSANRPRPHWEEDVHKADVPDARQSLDVAFLPVTCHLTCPVTDFASRTSTTGTAFNALRFTEFPPIIEALKSKKLQAGFLTVPIAMKMREQGAPVRMVCLGHRDGSQFVVRKDLPGSSLRDFVGRTIAIPSPFSNENFLLNKLVRDQGLTPSDFKFVTLPPPDMVAALAAKAIDGFIVAEPFCAKAEKDGFGRVLYYAKDVWPNYISCALVVHEDLIRERAEVVRDLVRGIYESGEWTEQNRTSAAKLVSPYFRQDEKLLQFVLTQPADRVTYRNLNPTDEELRRIQDMGTSLGFLKGGLPIDQFLDRQFMPAAVQAPRLDLSRMAEIVPSAR